ncbi:MAG: hypothetical protein ACOYMF_08170 [Bacteroidales bacterium]
MALQKRNRYLIAGKLVPHLPFILLGMLAVFLFRERLYADSGYYLFKAVNSRFFWIEHDRYVLAISQLLPLIGVWCGLSLKPILIMYSLGHVLFFYFLFIFVYFGLDDRRSGLMLILIQTVGILHSFFTPQFELYYGIGLLIVFYSLFRQNIGGWFTIVLLVLLEVLALTSHPFVFGLFAFLLLFDIPSGEPRSWKLYILLIMVYGGALYFKLTTFSEYEQGKVNWQFDYSNNKQYLNLISADYLIKLGKFLLRYYTEVLILWITGIIMLLRYGSLLKALLVFFAFAGFIAFVNTGYQGIEYSRYIEQVYFPMVPMALIPVIYSYPRTARPGLNNIVFLLLAGLILYRLVFIYNGSKPFMRRTNQIENMIASARQIGGSKFIASEKQFKRSYSMINWSYPIETILISACKGRDSTITIAPQADIDFNHNYTQLRNYRFLLRMWETYNDSYLSFDYFVLKPLAYKRLCDSTATPNDYQYLISNSRISINPGSFYHARDTVFIPVTIKNLADIPLRCSAGDSVTISYFWFRNKEMVEWGGLQTPLETDVYRSLTQDMIVAMPANKGKYQLMVDIKVKDKMWFGLSATSDMLVY